MFTIATDSSNDPTVHRTGCSDLKKKTVAERWEGAWTTPEEAALDFWGDIIAESEDREVAEKAAVNEWTSFAPCSKVDR